MNEAAISHELEDERFVQPEISPRGWIQIGSELILDRVKVADERRQRTIGGRRVVFTPPPGTGSVRPLDESQTPGVSSTPVAYELEPGAGETFIQDKGLKQSYGIFGEPGSGKTYLLMHLLGQIAVVDSADKNKKFGGLLLDPKAALVEDVRECLRDAGREADLLVISDRELNEYNSINVLDHYLDPFELGNALGMAAKSAGKGGSDPYWMNELGSQFGAALEMLRLQSKYVTGMPVTLRALADVLLEDTRYDDNGVRMRQPKFLSILADLDEYEIDNLDPSDVRRFKIAQSRLENLADNEEFGTIRSFMENAFGAFRLPKFDIFSSEDPAAARNEIYDSIINDGKIVLVSASRMNLDSSKILCTIIKVLFQQVVLTRFERFRTGELLNGERPVFFIADEYSDVATQIEGMPMGDATFFSLMRQFGCLGIVATQSVAMLENTSLGKAWKAITDNMAAKIFMKNKSPDTAKWASELAGKSDRVYEFRDISLQRDGSSFTRRYDEREKPDIPPELMLRTLALGQAVVIGATDGVSAASARIVMVQGHNWKPLQSRA